MFYEQKDVILYQIMDCLVEEYGYSIIRFQGQKQDLWLTNTKNSTYPVIRLNPTSCTSLIFEQEYLDKVTMFLKQILHTKETILILNTNKESVDFEEHNFKQIVVSDYQLNDTLLSIFPKLQQVVKKVENNEKEIVRLNGNLRKYQMKRTRERNIKRMPKFTMGIIGVCIVVYLLTQMLALYLGGDSWSESLLIAGAYYKTFIVAAHEYWRFLTAGFHHLSLMHLLMNMFALYSLGSVVEKSFQKSEYVAILFGSIISGNLLTFVIGDNQIAAGISGGLYGLMASMIVIAIENKTFKIPQVRASLLRVVWINLLISLLPGISLTAHLGGLFAGAVLSFLFLKNAKWKFIKPHIAICFTLLVGSLGYFGWRNNTVKPLYPTIDNAVLKDLRKIRLNGYADYLFDHVRDLYGE